MDRYYYFIAQLPHLYFGKETHITIDKFFEEGEKWLSQGDFSLLKEIDISNFSIQKSDPEVVRLYKGFEYNLREDLASYRRARKVSQEYKTRFISSGILKELNPLEIEKTLMKIRWDFIEQLEVGHHFDIDILILYLYKLQILERLSTFDKEKGFEKYKQICEVSYERS